MLSNLIVSPLAALLISPILIGIINKTKAFFAGRKGAPVFQLYYDLYRLFKKGIVVSSVCSYIFYIAPVIVFSLTLASTVLVPLISSESVFSFTGDFILLFYLLALARFFLIISALDTGSSFEGMGASRECFFSALAEPVIFISLLTILRIQGTTVLSVALNSDVLSNPVLMMFSAVPMFIIMLVENARIPFDDPNTHLELTMIHEVMILDNSGPDLALFEYASSVKLWIFSLLTSRIIISSVSLPSGFETAVLFLLIFIIGGAAGIVESVLARASLLKIPQLITSAGIIAFMGFFMSFSKVIVW